jgi:hypothetical protein
MFNEEWGCGSGFRFHKFLNGGGGSRAVEDNQWMTSATGATKHNV